MRKREEPTWTNAGINCSTQSGSMPIKFQVHKFLLHPKESESLKTLFFSFLYSLGCSKQRKDGSNSNWQLQANLVVKIVTKSLELFHKIISPAVRFLFRQRKLELLIL